MTIDTRHMWAGIIVVQIALLALILSAPVLAHAQTNDLQTTIRAALLTDPRTASLSAPQIDAMVQVLVQEAEKRGVSAHDINWRPQNQNTFVAYAAAVETCGSIPSILCAFNSAFGLDGSDPTIPIGLGITSAIMILIIALMQEMKRRQGLGRM